ncbi:uncharacterized protein LOC131931125 [Physella acuta]|uniref:uncharacterized protein LOC131931125 n=1 Tax=Physella acuta TaxID=109671 RepID=UPI0027DE9C51|nr:uncharacterized protein LOC131931125 [Physella acuta]
MHSRENVLPEIPSTQDPHKNIVPGKMSFSSEEISNDGTESCESSEQFQDAMSSLPAELSASPDPEVVKVKTPSSLVVVSETHQESTTVNICFHCRKVSSTIVLCQTCFAFKYCSEACREAGLSSHLQQCERLQKFNYLKSEWVPRQAGIFSNNLKCLFSKIPHQNKSSRQKAVDILSEISEMNFNPNFFILKLKDLKGEEESFYLPRGRMRNYRVSSRGDPMNMSLLVQPENFVVIPRPSWFVAENGDRYIVTSFTDSVAFGFADAVVDTFFG